MKSPGIRYHTPYEQIDSYTTEEGCMTGKTVYRPHLRSQEINII